MEKKQNCKIIKELLPNYIDGLTSEEVTKLIEEHLAECEECKKAYESMKSDINIVQSKNDEKKVKAFKKVNKKMRILKSIIFIIIMIYVIIYIKNLVYLNRIVDLAESNDFSNCYQKTIHTTGKNSCYIEECYQNNANIIYISTSISVDKEISRTIEAEFNGRYFKYHEENGVDKTSEWLSTEVPPIMTWDFVNKFGNPGLALIPGVVKKLEFNQKDCYLVDMKTQMHFIDGENGMEIKKIFLTDNNVYDFEYSFGTVTDEQIKELIDTYIK